MWRRAAAFSDCASLREVTAAEAGARQVRRWDRSAERGRLVGDFGPMAGRLVNQTLTSFDAAAVQLGEVCEKERKQLDGGLRRSLHGIFLKQRSTVEEELAKRLRRQLLRRMWRGGAELPVLEKVWLLRTSMAEYDVRVSELRPFFVDAAEDRSRAERRLSDLQWGIGDTPEATRLKQQWRQRRFLQRPQLRRRGLTVSFSKGLRVLLRPPGIGNFRLHSKQEVGTAGNPAEFSFSVFNDGDVADVYRGEAHPLRLKLQPTIGVNVQVR